MIPIAFLSYFNNCKYSIAVFTFLSPLSTLHDWSSTFCIRISPVSDPQPILFPPHSHFTCHFHLLPFPPISLDNYWHPSLSRVMDYISHQYPGATGSWSGLGHQFSPQNGFYWRMKPRLVPHRSVCNFSQLPSKLNWKELPYDPLYTSEHRPKELSVPPLRSMHIHTYTMLFTVSRKGNRWPPMDRWRKNGT